MAETTVKLNPETGEPEIERLCRYCGCLQMALDEAKGPHGYGLICLGCNRHNGWLSKALSKLITA